MTLLTFANVDALESCETLERANIFAYAEVIWVHGLQPLKALYCGSMTIRMTLCVVLYMYVLMRK